MGAGNRKMKSALSLDHHSEQFLFSNAFVIVYHSQDRSGQKFLVWPFKSLMTSLITQITIWSDRDRHDEQFVLCDLCQHMNSSKDICQKRQPFLGPLFKGPAHISWYRSKGLFISNIFCSTSDHKF